MANRKYERNFISNPLIEGKDVKYRLFCQGSKTGLGGVMDNYWFRWNCIAKPVVMAEPHSHDFDEILHFYGADASDVSDFQAIVEFSMGEEQEIYTITQPTIVYIPAGLVHAPINFKVVKKPVIFMNVSNVATFSKIVDGKKVVPSP
jgi:hypothetical protein